MELDISVIISVYNTEERISSAINSALEQTYPLDKYEVIVVDDGSSDGTLRQIEKFSDAVEIISKPHSGLADSVNKGIKRARGKYIIRLDADDTFEPDILAKEIDILGKEGYAAVGCYRKEIDTKTGFSKIVKINRSNIFRWIAAGILFRKDLLIKAGLYRNFLFEEYDILLRITKYGELGIVNVPLYNYYLHRQNMTLRDNYWTDGIREFMVEWDKRTLERFGFYKEFAGFLEGVDASKDKR